jgi:ABC-type dipeptide/oligopeptide/nickel transport system ATPase component
MPAVRVTGLRKSFRTGGTAVEAVSGIDLTVAAGEIFGLLGPNGAGNPVTELRRSLLSCDADCRSPGERSSSRRAGGGRWLLMSLRRSPPRNG